MKASVSAPPSPPTPSEPSPPLESPAPPPPASPPAMLEWPEWHAAADVALVILGLIASFLAVAYPARNSDLWLNLSTGRHHSPGEDSPGVDPVSNTGAERPWADTSWLYSLATYTTYKFDPTGGANVAMKAIFFVLAFLALMALRRPNHSLWPWAALIAIGTLAAAPYAAVRPVVVSMLFLSLTLVLVFRGRWTQPWTMPAVFGGLFWIWSGVDSWFILGPLVLLLVTLGDWLQTSVLGRPDTDADSPFWPTPPRKMLLRSLAIGVVGCLLNPMVLAAIVRSPMEALSQLVPYEFGFGIPSTVSDDPELQALSYSPLQEEFWYRRLRTGNEADINATAFGGLLLGAVVLAASFVRIRIFHLLTWLVFLGLAFLHVRLIPFFALAALPLIAGHLNGLSSRVRLGTIGDMNSRLWLTGSTLGRIICLAGVGLMLVAAYPGWLHAPRPDPTYAGVYTNYVSLRFEPDVGMVRAASLLGTWRSEGQIPQDVRGFHTSLELGNYSAWYAPGEKVYANTRPMFHRQELPDLLAVRRIIVGRRSKSDRALDFDEISAISDRYKTGYLAVASNNRRLNSLAVLALIDDPTQWTLWNIDGRSAVMGRANLQRQYPELFRKLAYTSVPGALGRTVTPLPDYEPIRIRPVEYPFADQYQFRSPAIPPEVDDVMVWSDYLAYTNARAEAKWQQAGMEWERQRSVRTAVTGVAIALVGGNPPPPPDVSDTALTLPISMLRSARQAVAATPTRPEGFGALAVAYRQQWVPALEIPLPAIGMSEQQLQLVAAQARYLARLPAPEECSALTARTALNESLQLADTFEKTRQLDLARETFRTAMAFARVLPPDVLQEMLAPNRQGDDTAKMILKKMEENDDRLSRMVQVRNETVQRLATTAPRRFQEAERQGLPAKAIETFKSASDLSVFGEQQLPVAIGMIVLELRAGRIEQAAEDLAALETQVEELNRKQRSNPDLQFASATVEQFKGLIYRLEGNYAQAAELQNKVNFPSFPQQEINRAMKQPAAMIGLMGLAGPVDLPMRLGPLGQIRDAILQEGIYQYDRGLLELCAGNISEAKARFEKALKPQGVPLADLDPERAARTTRYLEEINKARTP